MVQGNLLNLKKELAENDIKIETHLKENLPKVTMNKVQLEQVLMNLINNSMDSLKANVERDRQMRIRTNFDDRFVSISVEDEGGKIVVDQAEKMFDLFYTTKTEGLGMGLSISRSIIESYGGQLNYISETGNHNVFRISIPINSKLPI